MPVTDHGLRLAGLSCGSLSDVSFTIAPGEVVCLSGPSGSGKTRLLRAIADLDPHEGDVTLNGERQSHMAAHRWRRQVMLVPADSDWWAESVAEHFPGGRGDGLTALDLPQESLQWAVNRLSTGERQRLALLRAIAYGPHALLLDEPTANLDDATTRRVERWLTALIRERALPTLWVAHEPGQIERVAQRCLRIVDGRLTSDARRG